MRKFFAVLKIVFSSLFLLGIILIFYTLFFMPKEKRFVYAENLQGLFFSQKVFDILISQYPNYSDAYFEKSVAFNKRGNYEKGFGLLDKAVELDPKSHLGYRGWLKLHKLKDYQGCIEDLTLLDSLTPNHVDAPWGENIHYLLGLSYKGIKNYDLALTEFNKNLKTEKDSSWVNSNLFLYKGIIYNNLEEFDLAIDNFNACLKNNRDNSAEAYFHKGLSYSKIGLLDSARICFRKSKLIFEKGYKNKNVYNEIQDELYLKDILSAIERIDE